MLDSNNIQDGHASVPLTTDGRVLPERVWLVNAKKHNPIRRKDIVEECESAGYDHIFALMLMEKFHFPASTTQPQNAISDGPDHSLELELASARRAAFESGTGCVNATVRPIALTVPLQLCQPGRTHNSGIRLFPTPLRSPFLDWSPGRAFNSSAKSTGGLDTARALNRHLPMASRPNSHKHSTATNPVPGRRHSTGRPTSWFASAATSRKCYDRKPVATATKCSCRGGGVEKADRWSGQVRRAASPDVVKAVASLGSTGSVRNGP
ncbi:unnamed protein product [Protopolystoma xenopodis]|uniref:Uncharacterized protein n=1 Tax=Protopolystoma xenopodis TaxID=117903 RepID=A0A448XFS4_9PLAT|nr:unnamed protein product [Protopolystoma xenopodis]